MIKNSKDITYLVDTKKVILGDTFYLSKVGTKIVDKNKYEQNIIGFSLKKDNKKSLQMATYEMYERFWSVYPLACGIKKETTLKCKYYKSTEEKEVPLSVILSSYHKNRLSTDSTGLAYGTTIRGATERALLEICERHLLKKSWYSNNKLIHLKTKDVKEIDSKIQTFLLDKYDDIPFVISFVIKNNNAFIAGGSSIRQNIFEAIEKSEEEALMIAFSIENNLTPIYIKKLLKNKYKSLYSKDALYKINHLEKKIINKKTKIPQKLYSIDQIIKKVFKKKINPLVCVIHSGVRDYLVRVTVEGSEKPRDVKNSPFPQDPFC